MPGVRQIVTGPVATPPTDGLRGARGLGVVENPADPLDPQALWTRGYAFDFDACSTGIVRDPCLRETMPTLRGNGGRRRIEPFVVNVGRVCSTYGWQATDYVADAQRLLEAYQYGLIARELWRGDLAIARGWTNPTPGPDDELVGNPFLAWSQDPQFTDLVGLLGGNPLVDTMDTVQALAEMEQYAGSCSSGPALIHATRRMATLWAKDSLLTREGGRLFTQLGTQVVADGMYDGSGPTLDPPDPDDPPVPGIPADATREWAYVTGPITVRLESGPPKLTPTAGDLALAVDRSVNDVTYWAERKASLSWGCCHAAVAISTGFQFIEEPESSS